jgi:hypothetical protein
MCLTVHPFIYVGDVRRNRGVRAALFPRAVLLRRYARNWSALKEGHMFVFLKGNPPIPLQSLTRDAPFCEVAMASNLLSPS